MSAHVLELPALETAIIHVTRITQVEVGDRVRTTIEGDRLGYPRETVQVSTLGSWQAALAKRAQDLNRPLTVNWRNYSHGDRRLVLIEWAR